MTKMKKFLGVTFVSIVISLPSFLYSCYVMGPEADPDGSQGGLVTVAGLAPPSWVAAEYEMNAESVGVMAVTWEAKLDQYALYRRLGAGEWKEVGTALTGTSYADAHFYDDLDDPLKPKAVQYAVRTISGNAQSVYSAPSEPAAPMVLGLYAAIFTRDDGIPLTWDAQSGAESYNVYRSEKSDPTAAELELVATGIPPGASTVTWTDIPDATGKPAPSTIYYYLVTWVKEGTEYGVEDGLYVPGAYYSLIDHYEPNEEWASLVGKATSLFFASQPPLIYEIDDGRGNTVKDRDWYVYNAEPGVQFAVRVTLPADTPLADDELLFRFCYGGELKVEQGVQKGVVNEYLCTPPSGTSSKVPVYFGLRTNLSVKRNVIASYAVSIVDSL